MSGVFLIAVQTKISHTLEKGCFNLAYIFTMHVFFHARKIYFQKKTRVFSNILSKCGVQKISFNHQCFYSKIKTLVKKGYNFSKISIIVLFFGYLFGM